jgi:hypothetical protein
MLNHWNHFCEQITAAEAKLQEFLTGAGLSALQLKKLQKFIKDWNALKAMADDFDRFVNPIDPIKVESPFDQDDFRYIWRTWKEYLNEEHGITMRSRREQMALDLLAELSENNPDRAIWFLRFAMGHGYRKFFIVSEKDKTTPEPQKTGNDGDKWN